MSNETYEVLSSEVLLQGGNLSFIPDASFDHAVSFAVMMYISDASMACRIASELVRIVKPGMCPPPHMACMYPPLHFPCFFPPHMTCMVRIVKPGGKILIAQANDPVQIFKKKNQNYLMYRLLSSKITRALTFEIVSGNGLAPPPKQPLARLLGRVTLVLVPICLRAGTGGAGAR